MSFTITKDAGKITNKGGGVLKIWEVNADGTPKSPMVVADLGWLQDTDFKDNSASESIKDETLNTVCTVLGEREVILSGNLLQTGLEMLELVNETQGKYYGAYKCFADMNGNHQEMILGIGTVTPSINWKYPKPRTNYEIKFAVANSAISYDSTACNLIGAFATSVTIPAGAYYKTAKTAIV